MGRMTRCLHILAVIGILHSACNGQDKDQKIAAGSADDADTRLGLLATQLGLSPVPGESYGGGPPPGAVDIPSQDYLPTGGAPAPPPPPAATHYSVGANGAHGGNLVSSSQCQCVPVEHCSSYNGGGAQLGGNLQPGGGGDPYAGGQQGGIIPIIGGGGEGSYGQGGGTPLTGGGGGHGGNIPITGGGGEGAGPGYGNGGHPGDAGPAPNTDGAGLLDLRIVNRPPRPGGVQCLNGHVFCCDGIKQNGGPPPQENYGPGGSSGYANCGARNLIDVPGKKLEYGDAKFGAYPWMAVVLGKENNYVGAGALVSPYYVITAAHKIKSWKPGAQMKVRFGEWNAKEDDEPHKNVEVGIASVTIHPGFNSENLQNDIALVRLATPIDTKSYPHIKAVCLPQPGYQFDGQRCWVAGFGKDAFGQGKHSYIMKEVDLPVVQSDICEQRLRSTRLGSYFQLNRHSFLCAGGEEGKDACTGDGGSPLVCDTGKGGWQVAGLVAWGIGCADYGIPGVYVNVPNYADWINEEIYKY